MLNESEQDDHIIHFTASIKSLLDDKETLDTEMSAEECHGFTPRSSPLYLLPFPAVYSLITWRCYKNISSVDVRLRLIFSDSHLSRFLIIHTGS